MKKQIIATVLIASVAACGALLQLRDGQIQAWQKDGSWKCVDQEIRDIVNREPGDFALTGTAALESMALTLGDWMLNYYLDANDMSGVVSFEIAGDVYDPNKWQISDGFIRALCQSGRVCEVMGHQWSELDWQYKPTTEIVISAERERYQECFLCGKTRVRTVQWKEE